MDDLRAALNAHAEAFQGRRDGQRPTLQETRRLNDAIGAARADAKDLLGLAPSAVVSNHDLIALICGKP